jgi:glycosyltransferase involved in cell wall biosynthesis
MYAYGDISDLTLKISTVISSTALRDKLGEGGITFASTFSWENTAKQVILVLEQELQKY